MKGGGGGRDVTRKKIIGIGLQRLHKDLHYKPQLVFFRGKYYYSLKVGGELFLCLLIVVLCIPLLLPLYGRYGLYLDQFYLQRALVYDTHHLHYLLSDSLFFSLPTVPRTAVESLLQSDRLLSFVGKHYGLLLLWGPHTTEHHC